MSNPDLPDINPKPVAGSWPRIRQLLKRVGLLIGAGLLVWQTWRAIQQIALAGATADFVLPGGWALLAALLLAMLSHLTQMAGWREVMSGLGTPLSWRDVIEGYMLSMLPRYIPGTVWGYLSRGQWLYERFGTPFRHSSISSVLEMGLIVLSGLVFAAATYFHSLLAGVAVVILCAVGYAVTHKIVQLKLGTNRVPLVPLATYSKAFMLYGLIWPLYGLIIACLVVVTADLWHILIEFSYAFFLAWTSGLVAFFIPSGLGVREYALQAVLQQDGLIGPMVIVAPLLVRLATITSEILWLCVGLALKRLG